MKKISEIEEIVLKVCNDNKDEYASKVIDLDTELCGENGLDSLALMNVLIELEGIFSISTEDFIIQIFDAKTVGDICRLIVSVCQN